MEKKVSFGTSYKVFGMLVDAKVYELKKQCGWNEEMIKTYLKEKFL